MNNLLPLLALMLAGAMWAGASLLVVGSALVELRPSRRRRPPQL